MATLVKPAVDQITLRPFSLEEYHWLIEHGFFHEDERVELIQGVLYQMSPKGLRHAACLTKLLRLLPAMIGDRAWIRAQDPITLLESNSEPEPDLVLAAPRESGYLDHHPYPADVLLVVEIAHSSVEYDRRVKVPLFAAAGIVEYWLVNLREDRIEVYREPSGPTAEVAEYRQHTVYGAEDVVAPLALPACTLAVAQLLPAAGAQPGKD